MCSYKYTRNRAVRGWLRRCNLHNVRSHIALIREYCERKIRAAKRAARSELSVSKGDWCVLVGCTCLNTHMSHTHRRRHGYAHTAVCSTEGIHDTVPRIHIHNLTAEQFVQRFERPRLPTVITGACDNWPAVQTWTLEQLIARFGDHKFKVCVCVFVRNVMCRRCTRRRV